MKIALCIVSILFAGLSTFAALSQIVKERKGSAPHILMTVGGVLLIAAGVAGLMSRPGEELSAVLGCVMICIAAIWNGKRSGNFHIKHHIVRIALSLVLVAGFTVL